MLQVWRYLAVFLYSSLLYCVSCTALLHCALAQVSLHPTLQHSASTTGNYVCTLPNYPNTTGAVQPNATRHPPQHSVSPGGTHLSQCRHSRPRGGQDLQQHSGNSTVATEHTARRFRPANNNSRPGASSARHARAAVYPGGHTLFLVVSNANTHTHNHGPLRSRLCGPHTLPPARWLHQPHAHCRNYRKNPGLHSDLSTHTPTHHTYTPPPGPKAPRDTHTYCGPVSAQIRHPCRHRETDRRQKRKSNMAHPLRSFSATRTPLPPHIIIHTDTPTQCSSNRIWPDSPRKMTKAAAGLDRRAVSLWPRPGYIYGRMPLCCVVD